METPNNVNNPITLCEAITYVTIGTLVMTMINMFIYSLLYP